ncbi:YadA-like family protein [Fusobacterium necrophorum]|uniref:YadA-like family protein n=2 Tax=Fusobacterium necrophorum TaxID=859 RepID=UPI00254E9435|nr:YadA-like family protein [Fusobacterium necrophorum]MDK4475919.1 YadA-like family protein [Fusobacterium necrophorum]MDK4492754.1 YadA-like family protein [Fusobacterium necrophorum]
MKHNLEKDLKRWLKRKVSISLATIVVFAITGSVGLAEGELDINLNESTFVNSFGNFKDAKAETVATYFNKTNTQVNQNTKTIKDLEKLKVDLNDVAKLSKENKFTANNDFSGGENIHFKVSIKGKAKDHKTQEYLEMEESTVEHSITSVGSYTRANGKKKIHNAIMKDKNLESTDEKDQIVFHTLDDTGSHLVARGAKKINGQNGQDSSVTIHSKIFDENNKEIASQTLKHDGIHTVVQQKNPNDSKDSYVISNQVKNSIYSNMTSQGMDTVGEKEKFIKQEIKESVVTRLNNEGSSVIAEKEKKIFNQVKDSVQLRLDKDGSYTTAQEGKNIVSKVDKSIQHRLTKDGSSLSAEEGKSIASEVKKGAVHKLSNEGVFTKAYKGKKIINEVEGGAKLVMDETASKFTKDLYVGNLVWRDTSTKNNELIIGNEKNTASGKLSVAIGFDNNVEGENSIAVGSSNIVKGKQSSAFGVRNQASEIESTSVGYANEAMGQYSSAIGHKNIVNKGANNSSAIGEDNIITSSKSIAFGRKNTVKSFSSSVVGTENTIEANSGNSVAMGALNKVETEASNSIVSGRKNAVQQGSSHAVAFGEENTVKGSYIYAFGGENKIIGNDSSAIGKKNEVEGRHNLVLGAENKVKGSHNTVIGEKNEVAKNSEYNFMLGSNIKVKENIKNSIVLGKDSTVEESDVVSIGATGKERKIVHVAAGVADTDAVNVSQLKKYNADLEKKGLNFAGNDGKVIHKNLGDTLEIIGGLAETEEASSKNLRTRKTDDGKLELLLAQNLNLNSVTTGNTIINNFGVTIQNGDKKVTLSENGLDNGGNKIINVAEGTEKTDAVNKGQLDKAVAAASTEVTAGKNIDVAVTTGSNGQKIYQVGLKDKITLGEGEKAVELDGEQGTLKVGNKITMDGTTGNASFGKVAINGEQGTVNGLTNITWDPNNYTSGQAATEDQLKVVDKKVEDLGTTIGKGYTFAGDSGSVNKKLGDTVKIAGDGKNITTSVTEDGELKVALNKKIEVEQITFEKMIIKDKDGNTTDVGETLKEHSEQIQENSEAIKKGLNFAGNHGTTNKQLGDTMSIKGKEGVSEEDVQSKYDTENVVTTVDEDGNLWIKLSKNPKFNSVEAGDGETKVTIGNDGVKIGDKTYITKDGLDANKQKIVNVADGIIAKDSKDAVNGGQIHNIVQDINNSIHQTNRRIDKLDTKVNQGLANAAAMAGIEFLDIGINQGTVAAAVGGYKGTNAVAVGVQGAPTENTRVNAKVSVAPGTHTEMMYSVGAAYRFNWK